MLTLTIQAETIEELIQKIKEVKLFYGEKEKLNENFKLTPRKGKAWTEFEINFLTENYKAKNIEWIAGKLYRDKRGVYQMLARLYKKGLTKKNNLVKSL